MKKQLTEKTVYEPNENVKVAVENKPTDIGGAVVYAHKVTITINAGADKSKLSFTTDEDIAKFVEKIDFEDPQTSLLKD
jgi:hypothetical protein